MLSFIRHNRFIGTLQTSQVNNPLDSSTEIDTDLPSNSPPLTYDASHPGKVPRKPPPGRRCHAPRPLT